MKGIVPDDILEALKKKKLGLPGIDTDPLPEKNALVMGEFNVIKALIEKHPEAKFAKAQVGFAIGFILLNSNAECRQSLHEDKVVLHLGSLPDLIIQVNPPRAHLGHLEQDADVFVLLLGVFDLVNRMNSPSADCRFELALPHCYRDLVLARHPGISDDGDPGVYVAVHSGDVQDEMVSHVLPHFVSVGDEGILLEAGQVPLDRARSRRAHAFNLGVTDDPEVLDYPVDRDDFARARIVWKGAPDRAVSAFPLVIGQHIPRWSGERAVRVLAVDVDAVQRFGGRPFEYFLQFYARHVFTTHGHGLLIFL